MVIAGGLSSSEARSERSLALIADRTWTWTSTSTSISTSRWTGIGSAGGTRVGPGIGIGIGIVGGALTGQALAVRTRAEGSSSTAHRYKKKKALDCYSSNVGRRAATGGPLEHIGRTSLDVNKKGCGIVQIGIENERLFGHCCKSNTVWSGLTHRY